MQDTLRRHLTILGACLVALLTALGPAGPSAAGAASRTARVDAALAGWNVLAKPIDRRQHTAVPWGTRSDWLQPWRAYLDTQPATTLRDALGIQFNVRPEDAASTARLLARVGFRRARVEIPWNAMAFADPSRLDVPARWDTTLGALKEAGIRPLILLNAHDGTPTPHESFDALVLRSAPGSRTVWVDGATARRLVPGRSGFSFGDGPAASHIATSVSPSGQVTLSRPLPPGFLVGVHRATTLRYRPFAPPRTAGGTPHPVFEETLAGWLTYVEAVTAKAREVLGGDGFDIEIWNELPFGSGFLDISRYYDPVPPELQGAGSVTDELLRRTTAWLRDPAHGVSTVGIGNGFANLDPLVAGSTVPAGVTAVDRHPYYGGIKPMPGYAGSIPHIRNVDALGRPEGTQDASGAWSRPFLPTYTAFFPEYYLNAISTDHMVRDLAPVTTRVEGVRHGRSVKPPGARTAPRLWITEMGFRPNEGGGMTEPQARHVQAKAALRTLSAFVNKGASLLNFYAVGDGDWGMVDPRASDGGETMVALQRFMRAFAGPHQLRTRRSLELLAVADRSDATQFTGDGTAAHPSLHNRDVAAVLPFQTHANRFVVPVYVMTRNMARVEQPGGPSAKVTRYDLAPETYRLRLRGVRAHRLRVSALDPLTGEAVPARVVATARAKTPRSCRKRRAGRRACRPRDQAVVEVALTDAPRLLVLRD